MFYLSGLCINNTAARAIYRAQRGKDAFVSFRKWKKAGIHMNVGYGICKPYTGIGSTMVYSKSAVSGYKDSNSAEICRILRG